MLEARHNFEVRIFSFGFAISELTFTLYYRWNGMRMGRYWPLPWYGYIWRKRHPYGSY